MLLVSVTLMFAKQKGH